MDQNDIVTKRCVVCGWEYPPDTLTHGVCEDCQEKLDAHEERKTRGRKHRYDDER